MLYAPGGTAPHIWRYWKLPAVHSEQPTSDEAVDCFSELFEDAVRIRTRSDVPVGLTLSGGLDSSAVLHAACGAGPGNALTAFTSVYPASESPAVDERGWAVRAAAHYPNVRLDYVEATAVEWLDVLRRVVWHMDGPGYSPAVVPLWKIMEHAHNSGVPVLLEGQGGDELLGGYGHHSALALVDSFEAIMRRPSAPTAGDLLRKLRSGMRAHGAGHFTAELVAEAFPRLKRPYWQLAGALSTLRPSYVDSVRAAAEENREADRQSAGRLERRLIEDFTSEPCPGSCTMATPSRWHTRWIIAFRSLTTDSSTIASTLGRP